VKIMVMLLLLVAGCGGSSGRGSTSDLAMQDPVDAIVNGAAVLGSATHWINSGSSSLSDFEVAFFADHSGRYHNPILSAAVSITWQKLSPSSIAVTGADLIPSITGITGSVAVGSFSGNISGQLHEFTIVSGQL
jgi:hypothetical protein